MPRIIGEIGEYVESVEVGRNTFKDFNMLATRHGCHTVSNLNLDFTNKVFWDITNKNLPLNEKTIKEYISNL